MKTVGIFGGSFDPIHLGHLTTSYDVLKKRNLEKIIFVPCHISPHKLDRQTSEDIHRLNMVNLAIEDSPVFESSDYEIKKGNVSYTYDTLVELKKQYSDIELIIGFDNLVVFDKWHRPDDIFELVKVVVLKREIDFIPKMHNKYFDSAILLDTPIINISSTEIRSRVKNGLSIDYLVPQKVKEYISKNRLYI
jgi:nicotinate-nucleotide adenylyltransferase